MFSFFQRKKIISDMEWLGIDIHSHILPGIDDGAKNIDLSLSYIRQLQELGYSQLYGTPHVYSDLYPNTPDTIFTALGEVVPAVKQAGLTVKVNAAAEYMADATFAATEGLLTLPNNHILIEMSYLTETPNIEQIIFDLQLKGYTVILAHPERYTFYYGNLDRFKRFKEMGCLLQLNLLSIIGYYSKAVKATAEELVKAKLYDFAGTDLHHDRHLKKLTEAVQSGLLYKLVGHLEFKNKELLSTPQLTSEVR